MEDFYKAWFHLQQNDNPEYEYLNESESGRDTNKKNESESENPDQIVYETPELKLFAEKGVFKKQKIFNVSDQMFYFRIETKNEANQPLLSSILNFLHAGFIYILSQIRKKFNKNDSNIAYLTLYQRPILNGLNVGSFDLHSEGTNQ